MPTPASRAALDPNFKGTLIGVDSVNFSSVVAVAVNATTGALEVEGSFSSASVGSTGSAVPAKADYVGINVAGNLRGLTGVNPTGTVYAAQIDLASVGGSSVTLGQKVSVSSIPVVIASDNTLSAAQSGTWNVGINTGTNIIGSIKITDGTNSIPVTTGTNKGVYATITDGTNTMPTMDASARKGFIQITDGTVSFSAGQKTMANSFPVVLPSDQAAIPVTLTSTTLTGTSTVAGGKTNNNAAPGATNVGALVGIANAAQQTWTEGDQVLESMDLKGNQRVRVSDAAGNDRGQNVNANNAAGIYIDQTTIGTTNGVTPVPSKAGGTGWNFKQFGDGTVGTDWNGTKQQIVGTAATFGGYAMIFNPNTATSFIQVFNKTSANVTLGTTVPDIVIPIPGVASASATGAAANNELVHGIPLATALTVAITTTAGGSTAPSSKCYGCILYN